MLRAAIAFRDGGYGIPVLVGRDDVHDRLRDARRRGSAKASSCTTAAIYAARAARWSTISTSGCSGAAISTASSSGWSTRTATSSPRCCSPLGEADVMITGVTRPYAQTLPPDPPRARSQAGDHAVRHPRHGRPEPHRLHRRHHGHRAADRRAARRDRRSRPPPSPAAWATSRASPSCPIRISAIPRAASSTGSATA